MAGDTPLFLNWVTNQPLPITPSILVPASSNTPTTATYTVQPTDYLAQINSSGSGAALTLTLPNSLPQGFIFFISVKTNDIVLSASGGATILIPNGNATGLSPTSYTFSSLNQLQSATIIFDGTNFWVVTTQGSAQLLSVDCFITNGTSVITSGNKAWVRIPVSMSIIKWNVSADQSGSIVIDILRVNNGAISGATSIIGSGNKPTLSTQQFNGAAPSNWTSTTLQDDDWIIFDVTGTPTSVQSVTVDLTCQRL